MTRMQDPFYFPYIALLDPELLRHAPRLWEMFHNLSKVGKPLIKLTPSQGSDKG